MQPKIISYECPRGHRTVTIQVDYGDPSPFTNCNTPRCECWAVQLDPQPTEPAHPVAVWYAPKSSEVKRLSPIARDAVARGGLLRRHLTPAEHSKWS